ncbi:MAG: GLPGLI family protein [Bacteroidetes bacterium]|nr:MAG: GLPGLI family protein [Bacteroidota bacterium]
MVFFYNLRVLLLSAFVVTITTINSFGQNHRKPDPIEVMCFYNVTYRPDSTDMDYVLHEEFTLFIGADTYQSQSSNSLIPFLYINVNDLDGFLSAMAQGKIPPTRFNSTHYINNPKGKITSIENIGMTEYKYTVPMESLQWIIKPENKKIGNFAVQKALTTFGGREWVAWFTTEIPYSAGPYLFHGLPGLIVKISDTRDHYIFELHNISNPEGFEFIEIPDKPRTTLSKAEFFVLRDRFNQNPHASLMQSIEAEGASLTFDDPATAQRSANEVARRRNNPIELKAD